MEIKELVPHFKELVQGTNQEGTFLDTFSYTIQNNGEKEHLFIISQIETKDSSLSYIPNLIASFIKRELELREPREENQIFENALKKTNELIENLVKNNELKLDLGIALFNKDKVALSKIGKAKMLLFREGEGPRGAVSDIFENITQFKKLPLSQKRFANIISGNINKKDRLFFFIPNLRLNLRQKQIAALLAKSGQEDFGKKFQEFFSSGNGKTPLAYCGIHLEVKEEVKKKVEEKPRLLIPNIVEEESQIVATEVAKVPRKSWFEKFVYKLGLPKGRKFSNSLAGAILAVLVIIVLVFIFGRGDSETREALAEINEKIKLAESRFLLEQNYEARKALNEAIAGLSFLKEGGDKEKVQAAAKALSNRIENVNSEVKPALALELSQIDGLEEAALSNIAAGGGNIFISASDKVFIIRNGRLSDSVSLNGSVLLWAKDDKLVSHGAQIQIVDLADKRVTELARRFNFQPVAVKNYLDNLYFLGSNNIYKITNALVKPASEFEWLEGNPKLGGFVAFDLSNSIYVLTDQEKLATLFKGELENASDLEFEIVPGAELVYLGKDFLAVDPEQKIARVLNPEGRVKVSYDFSEIDEIKDVFFDKETSTLYILSPSQVWALTI